LAGRAFAAPDVFLWELPRGVDRTDDSADRRVLPALRQGAAYMDDLAPVHRPAADASVAPVADR